MKKMFLTMLLLLYMILAPSAGAQREIEKSFNKNNLAPIHLVFLKADIPRELWDDFATVAACESEFDTFATGDNGRAKGLFQIHWDTWAPWAGMASHDPFNPVDNAQLAYHIGERYSVPRGLDRWDQWAVKPTWTVCQERRDELTE